jgi:hypothetical protein
LTLPIGLALLLVLGLGVCLPGPLYELLTAAAAQVEGRR